MSIAQRQKNNSYTCSLFVSPAADGELLMDRGFQGLPVDRLSPAPAPAALVQTGKTSRTSRGLLHPS